MASGDRPIKSQHVRVNIDEHTHTHIPIHLSDTFLVVFLFFYFLMVYYITVKVVVPARYYFPSVLTKQTLIPAFTQALMRETGAFLHVHTHGQVCMSTSNKGVASTYSF